MNWVWIVLIVVGYFIYKALSNDSSSEDQPPKRKTGRSANYSKDKTKQSMVNSAKRQENIGNYDEASRLYLRGGQVFSAAKMKAMKGPQHANEAVELIKVNSPERTELITRNLANEFYYRMDQPATAASLLRAMGLQEEAEAVEVAANIASPVQTSSQQSQPASDGTSTSEQERQPDQAIEETVQMSTSGSSNPQSQSQQSQTQQSQSNIVDEYREKDEKQSKQEIDESEEKVAKEADYSNTLMMASKTLSKKCSACKRKIKSGDSFIYCLHCGHPGHWAHLGEMIKVTGKCPKCKDRLSQGMYEVS